MSKRILIQIDPLGNPTVEAEGFSGQGCTAATQAIEHALSGSGGVTREYKDEWAATNHDNNEQHQHNW